MAKEMEEKFRKDLKEQDYFTLREILNIREWQKIQDNFSTVIDAGIRTVDLEGKNISSPSREPRLCSELIKDSPLKEGICGSCLPKFLGGRGVVDKNWKIVCNSGLCNFIVPVKIDENKVLGYIIVGPLILVMRKPREEYKKAAGELNLDLEDFWNALLEIRAVSINGAQAIVELIKNVAGYILKSNYQNLTKKSASLMLDSPKLNRLLDALLDVSFQVSGADIGSIMFFDKERDELIIRTSRGISAEIVHNTRVKLGDGISGIVAEEGRSLLIDNNTQDNRIRPYLTRPYLKSSMVLPIRVEKKVAGVMNLGALQASSVNFDIDTVQLVNKFIDLATVALHE